MLSAHGLVIIAEELLDEKKYNYYTQLRFWVASDIGQGKTQRFLLRLLVPEKDVEAVKSKIQVGKVCEIVKADIVEYNSNPSPTPYVKTTTNISLSCKLDSFKFLGPCIYYEDMPNITEKSTQ